MNSICNKSNILNDNVDTIDKNMSVLMLSAFSTTICNSIIFA